MTRSLEQHDLKAAIRRPAIRRPAIRWPAIRWPARALGAEQDLINKVTADA